jgi:hypothetical protein
LLEPRKRLREFVDMVRILAIFKAGRLLNIYLFLDIGPLRKALFTSIW